ncbi:hypothetical protein F4776DRAFT_413399 [Hypoxylon sp. NC0597]|nr:hypothetical protein F4776DRAFT_413399 [Hypoxylon sp. NC0597]
MGEERNKAPTLTSLECQAEEVDSRPETSPYTSPHATLHFKDGPSLSVPTALLSKYPKLSSRCEWDLSLHLEDIPADPGHVLVHHILTGTYQCLKPKGSSAFEKHAGEFATSLRAYAVARDYELPVLEELAKGEIERLRRNLQPIQLLDTMMDAHPTFRSDDTWFHNYLKSMVKSLIESPPTSLTHTAPEDSNQTSSLPSILLKSMIELWREKEDAIPLGSGHLDTGSYQEIPVAGPSKVEPASSICRVDLPNPALGSNIDIIEATMDKKKKDKKKKKNTKAEEVENPVDAGLPSAVEPDLTSAKKPQPAKQQVDQHGKHNDDISLSNSLLKDFWSGLCIQPYRAQKLPFTNDSPNASQFGSINTISARTPAATNGGSFLNNQTKHNAPPLFESSGITKEPNLDHSYLDNAPLTTEALMWSEMPASDWSQELNRFLHICVQPKFAGFSPEELRLRHQLWENSRG